MNQKPDPTLSKVTLWITPMLLAIIGFFCINKLNHIEEALNEINGVKTELALIKKDVSNLDGRVSKIEQSLFSFINMDKLTGKHEEIYRLPKKNEN